MSKLNVALLQMASCGNDQDANLAKGEERMFGLKPSTITS